MSNKLVASNLLFILSMLMNINSFFSLGTIFLGRKLPIKPHTNSIFFYFPYLWYFFLCFFFKLNLLLWHFFSQLTFF